MPIKQNLLYVGGQVPETLKKQFDSYVKEYNKLHFDNQQTKSKNKFVGDAIREYMANHPIKK